VETLVELVIALHDRVGATWFGVISLLVSGLLCFIAIPKTTDLMVNNAAGLAGRLFGKGSRTLVINASTNNPEAAAMGVSFAVGRMGGWANPIGSLVANCYLMYLAAPIIVSAGFILQGRFGSLAAFWRLIWSERRLAGWHVGMALLLAGLGNTALFLMRRSARGGDDAAAAADLEAPTADLPATGLVMWIALGVLALGVALFLLADRRLKKKRGTLFTDIHDDRHDDSVLHFVLGTLGLVAAVWIMNALFLAWTALYAARLEGWFGPGVGTWLFTAMHYVLGALITSLPELLVAIGNYRRMTAPDLNTALGSASYSNLTNLVLCLLGLAIFTGLTLAGIVLPWG